MTRVQLLAFRLLWLSLFILLCNTAFGQGPSSERPLSDFLTENGTFQNPHNFSGSLNPEGFTLSVSDDGTPVFMNNSSASNNNWTLESVRPGADGEVLAMFIHDDFLYVAGRFMNIANVTGTNLARYHITNKTWRTMGFGHSGYVKSLLVANDFLYVGGRFTYAGGNPANGIARYNLKEDNGRASWSALGSGLVHNNPNNSYEYLDVNTLLVYENILFVGGKFTNAGGIEANSIARYDLSNDNGDASWGTLGDGVYINSWSQSWSEVHALAVFENYLFVGGNFENAGENSINGFARYNLNDDNGNSSWSSPETNKRVGIVYDILIKDHDMYIAAWNSNSHLLRYDINTGQVGILGESSDGIISDLTIIGDYIYAGGSFNNIGGLNTSNMARYNYVENRREESWESLDDIDGPIQALVSSENSLFIGGNFKRVDSAFSENIAYANVNNGNLSWKSFGGTGLNGEVEALLVHENILYVGGHFSRVGGISASNIARYDINTQKWSSLGDGVDGYVNCFVIIDDVLYVGGTFYQAGGMEADHIASYDLKEDAGNSSWNSIGQLYRYYTSYTPGDPTIYTMIKDGNNLIIGGDFTAVLSQKYPTHGSSVNSIARFDTITETWSGFGDGPEINHYDYEHPENIEGIVRGLAVVDDYLYIGGSFNYIGGDDFESEDLARYNLREDNGNPSWSAVPGARPGSTTNFILEGKDIIVAEGYHHGNNYIGRYNTETETWNFYDLNIEGFIHEIGLLGNQVFLGGSFSNAGGISAHNIVKFNFDTKELSPLGDGVSGSVQTFAVSGSDLYVGGNFTNAGGKPASYLARWHEDSGFPAKIELVSPNNNENNVQLRPKLDWRYDANIESYTLMVSETDDFSDPVIHRTNLDASSYQITENLKAGQTYFWRVRGTNDNGTGQWSNTWNFTTQSASTPPPVKVVLQSPANNSQHVPLKPLLNWNEATYAEQYILRLSESTDFSDPLIRQENIEQTSFQLTSNLDTDQTYYWQVRGTNSDGNGPWSLVWSFTTTSASTPLPGKIVLQSPENASHDIPLQPQLSWNVDDESDSYELVLSENSDFTAPIIHQTDLDGTTFKPTENLDYNTTYYWQVRGVNNTGNGEWSQTWAFTTIALPGQVSLLSPDNNGTDIPIRPELTWTSMDADETENYELLLSENPDFSNPVVHQTNLEETTLNVSEDLDYSTTYYWRVRGVNSNGNGPWSNTWNFTTILPPIPAQVNLISPADHINDIPLLPELVWEPAGQTENYELIVSTEPDLSNPVLHQTDLHQTTFQLSKELVYNQVYYWQVRGVNMYGDGSWSEIWSFTTIAPTEIALDPNWPNPFSKAIAGTTIRYRLPTENNVRLEIYNISGRRVAVLVNNIKPAGEHSIQFNGSGLADGVYFYRLITDDKLVTRKMLMLK
ncbi:T9SS type A sorting domain-containing protein [Rhodohalobacter sp. 614A]|uniref:T9SS type A sorting domain-containing protein n=1 Tax=Rhodohalobacter sp. 614A TaxID=2908649 RepID=UPI001F2F87C9|nr:T9SS type A sorting domain-containing protein [Rhodohalobacter sp. 614A]